MRALEREREGKRDIERERESWWGLKSGEAPKRLMNP